MTDLENKAARIIDTSWHYSWHWKRDHNGYLTVSGWEEMLNDAKERLICVEATAHKLRKLIPEVETELEKRKKWAEEDSEL